MAPPLFDAFRNPTEELRADIVTIGQLLQGTYCELAV